MILIWILYSIILPLINRNIESLMLMIMYNYIILRDVYDSTCVNGLH